MNVTECVFPQILCSLRQRNKLYTSDVKTSWRCKYDMNLLSSNIVPSLVGCMGLRALPGRTLCMIEASVATKSLKSGSDHCARGQITQKNISIRYVLRNDT